MEQVCESGVGDKSGRIADATQVVDCRCYEIYVAIGWEYMLAGALISTAPIEG